MIGPSKGAVIVPSKVATVHLVRTFQDTHACCGAGVGGYSIVTRSPNLVNCFYCLRASVTPGSQVSHSMALPSRRAEGKRA